MKNHLFSLCLLLIGLSTSSCNNASRTSTTDDSSAASETTETPDYSGTYELSSETASGTVEIKNIADGQIEFELTVADQSGCTGDIFGVASLANGIAAYSSEDCRELKFEFAENAVTISETDCGFYHGLQCTFAGTYQKN